MTRLATQIEISAQVWVCNGCGGHDPKSCGCNSTAHAEEMAAKREANRQAARRSYEKAKQNQHSSHNETSIDNVTEFPKSAEASNPWTAHGESQPDDLPEIARPIDETGNRYLREFLESNADFSNRFRVWLAKAKVDQRTRRVLSGSIHRCANDMTLLAQEVMGNDG